jgi:hypothetical protein
MWISLWTVAIGRKGLRGLQVDIVDNYLIPIQLKVIYILNKRLNNQLIAVKKSLSTCPHCPRRLSTPFVHAKSSRLPCGLCG